jgi:Glycosyl hydrolases family 2, TIM barrel domain
MQVGVAAADTRRRRARWIGVSVVLIAAACAVGLGAGAHADHSPLPCAAARPAGSAPAVMPTEPPIPPLADYYVTPLPLPVLPPAAPPPGMGRPSRVEIRGDPYHYAYYVDGTAQTFRGVGYNVAYRLWRWDCDARARRYDRDFAAIRAAGFDTLIGWDEGEFDDLTLAKAQQHGLGVVLPYDLPGTGDWQDPAYRQIHRQRVETLVRRYAGHPALRMWGLGNEVIYAIGDKTSPRARAFGQFLAELAERVHQLDPDHPVIYRDSEDVNYEPIRDGLRERGLEQPWMVYGVNAFTFRLQDILAHWPAADFRVPLLVSEFGLMDYPLAERPTGLGRMWEIIRQYDAYVLGGAVYAWTTRGIELTDAQYGLVDEQGQPTDGALATLGARLAATPGPR